MILCKLNSEQICEECLQPIEAGEECLRLYNNRGRIRFRHCGCQYIVRKRKVSFEEWLEGIRFMGNMKRINRLRKDAIKFGKREKIERFVVEREAERKRHEKVMNELQIKKQLVGDII